MSEYQTANMGDRMKAYERGAEQKFMPNSWVCVRLDGRAFSALTANMVRPFDAKFRAAMVEVTKALVEEFKPVHGYTQSDEITLVFYHGWENPMIFGGRMQKIVSTMASHATAVMADQNLDVKGYATFDCRAYGVPNAAEASNAVLWRERDSLKNSVSMVGRVFFTHKELIGKKTDVVIDMLKTKVGVDYYSYAEEHRLGVHIKRMTYRLDRDGMEVERHRIDRAPRYMIPMDHEGRVAFVTAATVYPDGFPVIAS